MARKLRLVCAAVFVVPAYFIPLSVHGFNFGPPQVQSKEGEAFAVSIPLIVGPRDNYAYGIYSVTAFALSGQSAGSTSSFDIELLGTNAPRIEFVGPRVVHSGDVTFTVEAQVNGVTYTRRFAVNVPSRSQGAVFVATTNRPTAALSLAPVPMASQVLAPNSSVPIPDSEPPPAASVSAVGGPERVPAKPTELVTVADAYSPAPPALPPQGHVAQASASTRDYPDNVPKATASSVSPEVSYVPAPAVSTPPQPSPSPMLATPDRSAAEAAIALTAMTVFVDPSTPAIAAESATGPFAILALDAEKHLGNKPDGNGKLPPVKFVKADVLDHIRAAEDWRMVAATKRSLDQFDAAQQALSDVDNQGAVTNGAQQVGAVLVNDSLISYRPSPAEAVLINFDKALEFWSLGDDGNAGIEFRRAEDGTAKAVERYKQEIDSAQANNDQEKTIASQVDLSKLDKVAEDSSMARFGSYAGFVNPATTYVHALFDARKGDRGEFENANNLMLRVKEILKEQESVERDLADMSANQRPCPKNDCVWVLAEVGSGPILQEVTTSIVVPLPGGAPGNVTLSLPKLVPRDGGDGRKIQFDVRAGDQVARLTELGNMNSVLRTEFEKRLPGIEIRAVLSAAIKAVAQQQAAKHGGYFGGLGASLLTSSVNHADTRMWQEIPEGWALVRVDHAIGTQLDLSSFGIASPIRLPSWPALIYIKVPPKVNGDAAAPVLEVLKL